MEAANLRNGNVARAHDWPEVLVPVIDRSLTLDIATLFRTDAASAIPELCQWLKVKSYRYAFRLPVDEVLHREIIHLITRLEVRTQT